MIDLLTAGLQQHSGLFHRQQIRKMIRGGLIPAVKIGREWRVDQAYLREFLDQHMAGML